MKTYLKIFLTIPLLFILLAASCKKEDELPEASQSGADIMAAKINGKKWEKKACWSCIGGGSGLSTSYSENYLNMTGEQNDNNNNIVIDLLIANVTKPGEYLLINRLTNSSNSYVRLTD